MTLEKLLIFGFAIAVAAAIAFTAASTADDREPDYTGYKGKVEKMIEKTR